MCPNLSISGHQPQNILITGGCGFIGSNFINFMYNKWSDAVFVNFDKLAVGADPEHVAKEVQENGRYHFIRGDLMDLDVISVVLQQFKIDTVIHFAAITHVDESY
uniref:NAD(P)-binding domain-containing protein n=1 Tax=Panagrolaimus sp. JU765 TaxID=591449 RepID=A0AC34PWP8_9BILA